MVHISVTTPSSSSLGATAPESLLVRYVKAHVRKDEILEEEPASVATALLGARSARGPSDSKGDANLLIDALAESTPAVRSAAAEIVVQGSRQSQFEAVTNAVVDLYQGLSRAGR